MGTFVAIEAEATSPLEAQRAVDQAFTAISDVARQMHPRAAGSDLQRINSAPLHSLVRVPLAVCSLLRLALRLHALTDGAFDPCLPLQSGRLTDLEVGDDFVICHAPVALDFGGFAKGYAVDRAIDCLMSLGCRTGLVNAGGDLRVFGARAESLLVRGPRQQLSALDLVDAALAVSDADAAGRPTEHQGYYVRARPDLRSCADPGGFGEPSSRMGTSALHLRYAAVIAPRAVVADALVKCVMLCPKELVGPALREFGARRVGR